MSLVTRAEPGGGLNPSARTQSGGGLTPSADSRRPRTQTARGRQVRPALTFGSETPLATNFFVSGSRA